MRQNLATKFVLIVSAIVVVALLNGLTAIIFTRSVVRSFDSAISKNLPSIKAAEELQIALLEQKGLVSAYILADGDSSWLERLRNAEATFGASLSRARESAHTPEERAILDRLEPVVAEHQVKCDKAALQFAGGHRDEAVSVLLHEVWPAFDKAYQLSEEFIEANDRYVGATTKQGEQSVVWAMWGIAVWSLCTVGLSAMLLWLLFRGVIIPLRHMASNARDFMGGHSAATVDSIDDELHSIGIYFQTLMSEMADTRLALTETRNRMLNAEKLAAVGKLAASVAHEMRNPLSSMKMWLHSIRKTAGAEPAMDRKFQILSDEINRLERIVRNVLEFSRPPTLTLQPCSVVDVIGRVLEIATPALEAGNIRVAQSHASELPKVMADSEQLTQVFANLLGNAAEAMPGGGEISISSTAEADDRGSSGVVVRIRDQGQGVPEDVRVRLFEPFFTTKDEGTGLGLCIAANIMARHGGQLVLESSTPRGATFAVRIPIATGAEQ